MQPWKPLLAILPAGLLIGVVGGEASRPVMLIEDERSWPQSVRERAREVEFWQPAYGDGGRDAYPRGYSYRPDLDYDLYAWPDQTDRSAELLAAEYQYETPGAVDEPSLDGAVIDLPQTRRAVAELAGAQAERLAAKPAGTRDQASGSATAEVAAADSKAFVLPPVPPPLTQVGVAPEANSPDETESD